MSCSEKMKPMIVPMISAPAPTAIRRRSSPRWSTSVISPEPSTTVASGTDRPGSPPRPSSMSVMRGRGDGRQVLGVDSASASGEAGVAVVGVNVSASAGAGSGGTAAALTTGVAGSDATAGGVTATAASAAGSGAAAGAPGSAGMVAMAAAAGATTVAAAAGAGPELVAGVGCTVADVTASCISVEAFPELPQRLAERRPDVRQASRSDDQQGDGEDGEKLTGPDVEGHRSFDSSPDRPG